jgi:hypothetical protein
VIVEDRHRNFIILAPTPAPAWVAPSQNRVGHRYQIDIAPPALRLSTNANDRFRANCTATRTVWNWPVSDRRTRWRSLTSLVNLHLGLLGDLQCIVDLDSEIPNGAFEFGMAEEKLNGPDISCSPIDQRGFRPAT